MGPGHGTEGERKMSLINKLAVQTIRTADDECQIGNAVVPPPAQALGEVRAG